MKSRGYQAWRLLQLQDLVERMGRLLPGARVVARGSRPLRRLALGQLVPPEAERRCLLVGLCYEAELRLKGSWNDVKDLRSWLEAEGIFSSHEIREVTDQRGGGGREEVLQQLQWLLQAWTS